MVVGVVVKKQQLRTRVESVVGIVGVGGRIPRQRHRQRIRIVVGVVDVAQT